MCGGVEAVFSGLCCCLNAVCEPVHALACKVIDLDDKYAAVLPNNGISLQKWKQHRSYPGEHR